jgi:hypothetical protein
MGAQVHRAAGAQVSRPREKGEPRQIPTFNRAMGRCRRNGWSVVECLRVRGGYRINYVTSGAQRRPGTLRAR